MEDLKECPFCGGEARLFSHYSDETEEFHVFVQCQFCNAEAHKIRSHLNPEDFGWKNDVCKMAVNAWNRRV